MVFPASGWLAALQEKKLDSIGTRETRLGTETDENEEGGEKEAREELVAVKRKGRGRRG